MIQRNGEDELLRRLRRRLGPTTLIGDDAAVLPELDAGRGLAVTMDSQISGVHFVADLQISYVARRLLAVNLSDLAAMGAEPTHAFLALSSPRAFDHESFFQAFVATCRKRGVTLAGGDLSRSDQLTATLTLLGRLPENGRWLRRGGARPGHRLWLGGTVGESAAGRILIARGARPVGARVDLPRGLIAPARVLEAGRRAVLRHLLPEPQLALGRWLGRQPEGAAMDVSDGVARDLHRLCRESGAGAEIDAAALPLADRFTELCTLLSVDPFDLALGGGEDYVLLFTLPEGVEPPAEFGCRSLGTITGTRNVSWVRDGKRRKLPPAGWDHLNEKSPGQAGASSSI